MSQTRTTTPGLWAGGLIVAYGAAHVLGALVAESAADHASTWVTGELWGSSLSSMSPAMSAYWLSVNSFGPPLVVVGVLVIWLSRRGIEPPALVGWTSGAWALLNIGVLGFGVGQDLILLAASLVLVLAPHRKPDRHASQTPGGVGAARRPADHDRLDG